MVTGNGANTLHQIFDEKHQSLPMCFGTDESKITTGRKGCLKFRFMAVFLL